MFTRVRNIKLIVISLMMLLIAPPKSKAQSNEYSDSNRPRLVVVINAPQIRHNYLYKFAHNFSDWGIKRMINEGISYSNARYNYMFTQSSPGISTIMTGTQPSQHGVIGDGWINFTTNQKIDAAIDYNQKGIGCNEEEGCYSPKNLLVSTIGDEIKRYYPESKVISISMDPESAVFSSGKIGDAAYWFDERYGGWATSSYYMDNLPGWVGDYNGSQTKMDYLNKKWTISKPFDAYIYKESNRVLIDNSTKISFSSLFKSKESAQFSTLKETPMGNSYITDFAVHAIANEKLGGDDSPDMLVVNYGVLKHLTQSYGIESMDLEDAIYQLDNDIAALLSYLDEEVGKENYVVVLTSAHGTSDNITGERETSGRFNATQFRVLMGGFMNTQFGSGEWVSEYRNRQLYINRRLAFEKGISITDIQSRIATFALQFNGVAQTITATALQNNYYGKSIMQKIQNSFFPKHSGDVIINLLPGWIEIDGQEETIGGIVSSSGSPYEYDTHVPLIWSGAKFVGKTVSRNIDMIDIAPTIAELLHIPHPNASEGTHLTEIISELN